MQKLIIVLNIISNIIEDWKNMALRLISVFQNILNKSQKIVDKFLGAVIGSLFFILISIVIAIFITYFPSPIKSFINTICFSTTLLTLATLIVWFSNNSLVTRFKFLLSNTLFVSSGIITVNAIINEDYNLNDTALVLIGIALIFILHKFSTSRESIKFLKLFKKNLSKVFGYTLAISIGVTFSKGILRSTISNDDIFATVLGEFETYILTIFFLFALFIALTYFLVIIKTLTSRFIMIQVRTDFIPQTHYSFAFFATISVTTKMLFHNILTTGVYSFASDFAKTFYSINDIFLSIFGIAIILFVSKSFYQSYSNKKNM